MSTRSIYGTVKRIADVTLSVGLLALLCIPMGLVALSVKRSSPGAVLFRGARAGLDGRPFTQYKFRTMTTDAAEIRNEDGSLAKPDDDPRVTAIGRHLRRTSIDELPQLLNILRGSMSFVGPRPDPVSALEYYTPIDWRRLSVTPGLTGLAQVNGRNSLTWDERRRLDDEYVRRQSFLLDLKILMKTLGVVATMRGITTK
jgi:lipopolysaccharide/colanic/teichoic acid biosynthesis glycosyltransferase